MRLKVEGDSRVLLAVVISQIYMREFDFVIIRTCLKRLLIIITMITPTFLKFCSPIELPIAK
jgi:hypothetical protein